MGLAPQRPDALLQQAGFGGIGGGVQAGEQAVQARVVLGGAGTGDRIRQRQPGRQHHGQPHEAHRAHGSRHGAILGPPPDTCQAPQGSAPSCCT